MPCASVTTVVIGAGQSGLAMSKHLSDRAHRPCRARARRGGQLVADGAVGLPSPADAQLAKPAARLCLRRARSRRLHDHAGDGRLLAGLRGSHPCPRGDTHDRDSGQPVTTAATRSSPIGRPWPAALLVFASGACNVPAGAGFGSAGYRRSPASRRSNTARPPSCRPAA